MSSPIMRPDQKEQKDSSKNPKSLWIIGGIIAAVLLACGLCMLVGVVLFGTYKSVEVTEPTVTTVSDLPIEVTELCAIKAPEVILNAPAEHDLDRLSQDNSAPLGLYSAQIRELPIFASYEEYLEEAIVKANKVYLPAPESNSQVDNNQSYTIAAYNESLWTAPDVEQITQIYVIKNEAGTTYVRKSFTPNSEDTATWEFLPELNTLDVDWPKSWEQEMNINHPPVTSYKNLLSERIYLCPQQQRVAVYHKETGDGDDKFSDVFTAFTDTGYILGAINIVDSEKTKYIYDYNQTSWQHYTKLPADAEKVWQTGQAKVADGVVPEASFSSFNEAMANSNYQQYPLTKSEFAPIGAGTNYTHPITRDQLSVEYNQTVEGNKTILFYSKDDNIFWISYTEKYPGGSKWYGPFKLNK